MPTDVRMKGFEKRSSVTEVLALIESRVSPLGMERVPFRAALGRILAEDVRSDRNVPPHPRSAMDGYAVRAGDLPGKLRVVGEIKAADQYDDVVESGEAVRIMTGAKVPEGADAVVMVEATKSDGDRVMIDGDVEAGQHVLKTGEDLTEGQTVLAKGRKLRPQDISMLVSVGALEVAVQRRPRVRIVPTGTELVRAGIKPKASEIVESNSFMLEALALRDGADPVLHPLTQDDPEVLKRALLEPGVDIVVVTGGTSVGKEDFAPIVVAEIGELPIHGVWIRPASPTGLGFVKDTICVLTPGYPVASFVAWDFFVRPIVQRMTGAKVELPYRKMRAHLARSHKKLKERVEIQRVTVSPRSGGLPLASLIPGGAALLSTATRADGFLYLPAGEENFEAGRELDVHLYD